MLAIFPLEGAGNDTPRRVQTHAYDGVTISTPTTWTDQQVTITGTLRIVSGGSLTLDHTTLLFSPAVEDTDAFEMHGGRFIAKNHSLLKTRSGKQWNLQAHGACTVHFQSSRATNHSGLRMFDACVFTADDSGVEEVQVHDNAILNIENGSQAYVVLFFTGAGSTITFSRGELVSGSRITRSFNVPTGTGTTGKVRIKDSTIVGFQLDLVNNVRVNVIGGTNIILAMHLHNVGNSTTQVVYPDNITSGDDVANGSVDFSAYTNPKFVYKDTQISSLNVYLTGTSNVSFTGTLAVNEPDATDSAILTFGPGSSIYANLAMTHGRAQMIFNGSTLLDGDASFPSFTAEDRSVIRLNSVNAIDDVRIYSVGQGQVHITGGSGWSPTMFQSIDPQPPGGTYMH